MYTSMALFYTKNTVHITKYDDGNKKSEKKCSYNFAVKDFLIGPVVTRMYDGALTPGSRPF